MRTILVSWKNLNVYHKYWVDHHRLRKEIFVNRLGWDVPNYDELEFDEFDTPPAHYALCIDDDDRVCGMSRLMSTRNPYMIEKLWPEWLEHNLPKSDLIWEVTRFGVAGHLSASKRSEVIDQVTRQVYQFGLDRGVDEYLIVMPTFIYDRILIPRGYDLTVISDARWIDRIPTAIASIKVHHQDIVMPSCAAIAANQAQSLSIRA